MENGSTRSHSGASAPDDVAHLLHLNRGTTPQSM